MTERINWIDSLKGWAILFIMFVHLENWTKLFYAFPIIERIINRGSLGVEITYLVNAFLFATKACKNNDYTIAGGGIV